MAEIQTKMGNLSATPSKSELFEREFYILRQ